MKNDNYILTDAQLKSEINRCEFCEEKPCKDACPANCSPADFIIAAKIGAKSDYERAAAIILSNNPLGGICGNVCPDYHCMKACVHNKFDNPVNIPKIQATIISKAKELDCMPKFENKKNNKIKIGIIGAGPSGLSAAIVAALKGYNVTIFEKEKKAGGMCNLIPNHRLEKKTLESDINFILQNDNIKIKYNKKIDDPNILLEKGFSAVIVATGLDTPYSLKIKGEEKTINWLDYLKNYKKINHINKRIAVIGGGAIAVDCAINAVMNKAKSVEIICLEKFDEMKLSEAEKKDLLNFGINLSFRTKVEEIKELENNSLDLLTRKVILQSGKKFHLNNIIDDEDKTKAIRNFDIVIVAIGSKSTYKKDKLKKVFYAGDMRNGPTTVVEAVASGKNAIEEMEKYLALRKRYKIENNTKSYIKLEGYNDKPVSLESEFFGRKIISPFLLSAAPPSDGYEQMKKAYEAGWAGGVMKTTFDNVPIHIPSEYMFAITNNTYGNCDNVSGHPLDRVCKEIKQLVEEFPDRLTMVSTGGPVTGNDKKDKKVWQSNTKKLEKAGAMGIEYSLSCPQGGDGTKGDIVSQDAELTAKIIDWVMEVSDPNIPKLFKLTAAVTAIQPIINEIKIVFDKYPNKKAGLTLANTFPSLAFRKGNKKEWDEGIIIGLSGEGVIPISYLTLAKVSNLGVKISGNGGAMNYKAAADFLALGVETVQFCTIVMKYGYKIIDELHSGLSHLLKEKGLNSVKELIGIALPKPITEFMELSPIKKISDVNKDLCTHCGNCTRCSYLAISFNAEKIPITAPDKCIGCSICVQKCFSGALFMRERTEEELKMLKEI